MLSSTKTLADYYKNEDTPVIILLDIALRFFAMNDLLELDPVIIHEELEKWLGVDISEFNHDKLHAGIVLLGTNTFEQQYSVFETICRFLNNQPDTFDIMQPLEAEEIACALPHYELIIQTYLDEEGQEDKKFSEAIRAVVGHIFYEYGCLFPPSIFKNAILPFIPKEIQEQRKEQGLAKDYALNEIYSAKKKKLQDQIEEYKKLVKPKSNIVQFFQKSPLAKYDIELKRNTDIPRDIEL